MKQQTVYVNMVVHYGDGKRKPWAEYEIRRGAEGVPFAAGTCPNVVRGLDRIYDALEELNR